MSGKHSRERRVEAVNAARAVAYAQAKREDFDFDERQERIFEKYVNHFCWKRIEFDSVEM